MVSYFFCIYILLLKAIIIIFLKGSLRDCYEYYKEVEH